MNIQNDDGSREQDVNKYSKCCPYSQAYTLGHQDTLRQILLHAWNRFQWCPFSNTQMSFGPCATVQVRPCHHNRHTIKRIYSPRCFKKIKNWMPTSWNLWLVSWAMSLHIWTACRSWHNLHLTQTCLIPLTCRGAVSCEDAEGQALTTIMYWHIKPRTGQLFEWISYTHPSMFFRPEQRGWQDYSCQTELQLGGSNSKAQVFWVTMTPQVTKSLIPK